MWRLALGAGAEDAVGWAENPIGVVARIASLVRRSRLAAGQLGAGELRIDLIDRRVVRAGRLIRLPLREFDLLAYLARVPDRPLSRSALLKAVWRIDFDPGTKRVEVHMSRLRAKGEIGRASCRERGCKYVYILVAAVSLHKKKKTKPNKSH